MTSSPKDDGTTWSSGIIRLPKWRSARHNHPITRSRGADDSHRRAGRRRAAATGVPLGAASRAQRRGGTRHAAPLFAGTGRRLARLAHHDPAGVRATDRRRVFAAAARIGNVRRRAAARRSAAPCAHGGASRRRRIRNSRGAAPRSPAYPVRRDASAARPAPSAPACPPSIVFPCRCGRNSSAGGCDR